MATDEVTRAEFDALTRAIELVVKNHADHIKKLMKIVNKIEAKMKPTIELKLMTKFKCTEMQAKLIGRVYRQTGTLHKECTGLDGQKSNAIIIDGCKRIGRKVVDVDRGVGFYMTAENKAWLKEQTE